MIVPDFIVKSSRHWKKNYFFSEELSDFGSSFEISAAGASSLVASAAGASSLGASAAGATLSSVTVSGFTSTSIPIFFLIFSAILADLPVLSLK